MRVELKRIHSATKKLASGERVKYYYAWKGGPRIMAAPGTQEFIDEVVERRKEAAQPDPNKLSRLIADFKDSGEFRKLRPDTQKEYRRYLDLIGEKFGDAPLGVFERRQNRGRIKAWRDTMQANPRKADYALQTLTRLLYYGVDQGELTINIAARIKRLHKADRSDIIWEDGEIARLCAGQSPSFCAIVDMARMTGLRRSDLARITWSADKGTHLEWKTQKTNRPVMIPVLPELRRVLDRQPKGRAVTILTNSKGRPWSLSGIDTAINRAKGATGIKKHLHDMRGTAVTFFCLKGLSDLEIAEIVGWEVDDVARVRRKYVNGERIMRAAVERLTNESVKPRGKPRHGKSR